MLLSRSKKKLWKDFVLLVPIEYCLIPEVSDRIEEVRMIAPDCVVRMEALSVPSSIQRQVLGLFDMLIQ